MRWLTTTILVAIALAVVPTGTAGADAGDGVPPGAFATISTGESHACVLDPAGVLRCWGEQSSGQAGLGDTEVHGDEPGEVAALTGVDLGTGRRAITVAAGQFHTCAILDTGQLKCWGDNGRGQLGLGNTAERGDEPGEMGDSLPAIPLGTGRTATAVTVGSDHTCAILDNGRVKCWGDNNLGQLGLGDTAERGDQPGEMGNALPALALGTGRTATAISAGDDQTCALLDNGRVKCWGGNGLGQLGLGDTDGRGDQPGEMGNALPALALGTGRTATAISTGYDHTCALLDDAQIRCWGSGEEGRLGTGATAAVGDQPAEMGGNLVAVPLGTGRTAVGVTAQDTHSCALLDDATVKCWGDNYGGKLGVGDTDARGDQPDELGDALPAVDLGGPAQAVAAMRYATCALLVDQTVKCWGANTFGYLGLGDAESRLDEPGEGGASLPVVPLTATNDAFAASRTITGARGTLSDTNANAVKETPDEPDHAGLSAADSSVWYSWNAPATGPAVLDTAGSSFDTVLAVYTGSDLAGLAGVAANDDTNSSLQSEVRFDAVAGTTYRIAVAGFNGTSGRIALTWRLAMPCQGQPVTVALGFGDSPTGGDDVIRGTTGSDTINAGGGNDRVCAEAGDDTVNAGPGGDTVNGDAGRDILRGGPGSDTCNGGPQQDTATACEVRTSIP